MASLYELKLNEETPKNQRTHFFKSPLLSFLSESLFSEKNCHDVCNLKNYVIIYRRGENYVIVYRRGCCIFALEFIIGHILAA